MRGRNTRRLQASCEQRKFAVHSIRSGRSRWVCCSLTGTLELFKEKRKFLGLGVDKESLRTLTQCLLHLPHLMLNKSNVKSRVKKEQVSKAVLGDDNASKGRKSRLDGRNHAYLHPALSHTHTGSSGGTQGFSPVLSSGVLSLPSAHQKASGGAGAATPDP